MESDKEKFFALYPLFIETPNNSNKFFGFYKFLDVVFRIRMDIPLFPLIKKSRIFIFNGITQLDMKSINLGFYTDIFEFFKSLNEILEIVVTSNKTPEISTIVSKIQYVMDQVNLRQSEKRYTVKISSNYNKVFINNFYDYPNHYLNLMINDELETIVSSHSLPDVGAAMFKTHGTIKSQLAMFQQYLESMEEFYWNMNTIDELCFVVDPILASTKCNYRIIKIEDKMFLKIIVNPLSSSSIQTHFIGPSYKVESLRQKFNSKIHEWDTELDIYRNLLKVFDLIYFTLKHPPEEDSEENEQNCGICLSYRFNDQIPMISCDNEKCDTIYHSDCLKKWFEGVNTKTILLVTMGTCPFCKEKISMDFLALFTNET